MAVAKAGFPQDFEHEFVESSPAPSLMEEISRRASSAENFPETCILDSTYGIADAMAMLQAVSVHVAISTSTLVYQNDFIKLSTSKAQQSERFKSPLERKKLK